MLLAALIPSPTLAAVPAAVADDAEAEYGRWMAEKAPALVTVKYVLKVKMGGMFGGGDDEETDSEITGVVIDPSGLVLCSNTQLGGVFSMMGQFMGPMAAGMTITPTDIKVLVGDDTEGIEAKLVARDTELDLAWVRISEPGERKFAACDLARSAEAKIGHRLFGVRRMGKYFDRAVTVSECRVGGITKKPRELYVPSGAVSGAAGLPLFNAEGLPVGIVVMQMPDTEGEEANPLSMLGGLLGMQDSFGGLILPAAEVVKATKRALETAAAKEKEAAESATTQKADAEDEDVNEKDADEKTDNKDSDEEGPDDE